MWILKGCWSSDHNGTIGQDLAMFSSQHGAERYFVRSQVRNPKRGDNPFIQTSMLSGFLFSSLRHVEGADWSLPLDPTLPHADWEDDELSGIIHDVDVILLSSDDLTPHE
jgi:hypothetical protein